MRKLLWCCSAAGVLAGAGLFTATFFACRNPESVVGRCVGAAAGTSVLVEPMARAAAVLAKVTHQVVAAPETSSAIGSVEECVPPDPQPIEPEPMAEPAEAGVIEMPQNELPPEAAPIVIHEEDPMPHEGVEAVPSTIDINGMQEPLPPSACPMVMPYCTDDDEGEVAPKPSMPYADEGETKRADGSEETDDGYKAWKKLFEGAGQESRSEGEELPAPAADIPGEPKCQEDCHRHEHYSGCPYVTCPYTGKSYPLCGPAPKPGKEEPSEEPAPRPNKPGKKHGKGDKDRPRTEGVDTMEYRPSDGKLNEYGPGPF
jgi:hypothetical protein